MKNVITFYVTCKLYINKIVSLIHVYFSIYNNGSIIFYNEVYLIQFDVVCIIVYALTITEVHGEINSFYI